MKRPPSLVVYRARESGIPFERILLDDREEDDVVEELAADPSVLQVVREDPPPDGYGLEPTGTWERQDGEIHRRPYKTGVLRAEVDRAALRRVCREHGIVRLAVFGSAITDDFDPVSSDVDVLVEIEPAVESGLWLLDLERDLAERVFAGRAVDLSTFENASESKTVEKSMCCGMSPRPRCPSFTA